MGPEKSYLITMNSNKSQNLNNQTATKEGERGERNRVLGARIASRENELLAERDVRRAANEAEISISGELDGGDSGGEEREKQGHDHHRTELAIDRNRNRNRNWGFLCSLWLWITRCWCE